MGKMKNTGRFTIAIHGGAGPNSNYIKENIKGYELALKRAVEKGYQVLLKDGTAVEAVELAVRELEDDPLFNAGRGSALNSKGEIEMDAAIMDGETLNTGAIAIVKKVKNPVSLAKYIMENMDHVFIAGQGAFEIAQSAGLRIEPEPFFITPYQYEVVKREREKSLQNVSARSMYGTVGAVALDKHGNLAAATSTGGAPNCSVGRVSDSCVAGAGCYANNNTCAISATGDGEFIIRGVVAHTISSLMEFKNYTIQQACDFVIHQRNKQLKGEMGVIGLDAKGNLGIAFNSERMHRAWMGENLPLSINIFK
jgi:beta-aspartyl-peptidase (threonine type)